MNQPIFTTNFSLSEPNITSTQKKNNEGKCCFHDCSKSLPKEKYHYMGFLACEDCGKKLQADRAEWEKEYLHSFIASMG
jgi:hypothetical protein